MHIKPPRRAILCATALAVGLGAITALAQESPGEPLLRFGVDTSLRGGEIAFGETGILSETDLSARYITATRTQSLEFGISGTLRAGSGTDDAIDLVGPDADFAYSYAWSRGSFSIGGEITQRDLRFSEAILDPDDPDSLLEFALDPDAFDLRDGVQRTRRLSFSFSAFEDMPVGLELGGSIREVEYPDDAAGVEDTLQTSLNFAVPLRLTPRLTARLGASYDLTDGEETRVETQRAFASLRHEASERLVLGAEIGLSSGRTERDTGLDGEEDGLSGSLSVSYAMPRGSIGLSVSRDIEGDAVRDRLDLTHAIELPGDVALSYGAGYARADEIDALTGSISLSQPFKRGGASISLSREISGTVDGESVVSTDLDAALTYELTSLAAIDLGASYQLVDEGDGESASAGSLTATLSRQLTPDWALRGGAEALFSGGESRAEVFVGLSRNFEIRP